jgi:3-oxoacyl-[acyl-carrier protein] reductase
MDLGLTGKVALVAGASSGLGYATAELLAREGARVVMCSRDSARIARAAEGICQGTPEAELVPLAADVSTTEGCEHFVETALSRFGRTDILVCNSGGPPPGHFDEVDERDWSTAVDLLLFSAVRLTRLVLPSMQQARSGSIVYITGFGVRAPGLIADLILSAAIRSGVTSLGRALATDLATSGIRVNSVLPGRIATDRHLEIESRAVARGEGTPDEVRARLVGRIPLGRIGRPEELASAIAFLVSDRASFITGQALAVDGGEVPNF